MVKGEGLRINVYVCVITFIWRGYRNERESNNIG